MTEDQIEDLKEYIEHIIDAKLDRFTGESHQKYIDDVEKLHSYLQENMNRLQNMMKEFKGLVAMVRGEKSQSIQADISAEVFMACVPFISNTCKEKFKYLEKKIKKDTSCN